EDLNIIPYVFCHGSLADKLVKAAIVVDSIILNVAAKCHN
ncbi:840_t:CDS:1, partial [Funneliformis geosporum]